MDDINKKLDSLFIRYENTMKNDGYNQFRKDGLLRRNGRETEIWNNAKFRLCFLLKDPYLNYDAKNGADCYSKIGHAVTVLTW